MTAINNFLIDFGWIIMFFMAFLIVMALINQISNFFKILLKWYKSNYLRYKL